MWAGVCAQCERAKLDPIRLAGRCAVQLVPDDRVTEAREMCPDLMGSSGLEVEFDDRTAAQVLDDAVARDGALAIGDDRPSVVVTGIAPERTIDHALPCQPTFDGRAIAAVQGPQGELPAELVVGGRGLRERDEPARTAIEAVGRTRPVTRPRLIGTRVCDPQH